MTTFEAEPLDAEELAAVRARLLSDVNPDALELAKTRAKTIDSVLGGLAIVFVLVTIGFLIAWAVVRTSDSRNERDARNCAAIAALPLAERQGVDVNRVCG